LFVYKRDKLVYAECNTDGIIECGNLKRGKSLAIIYIAVNEDLTKESRDPDDFLGN